MDTSLDWSDLKLMDPTDKLNSILDLIGEITEGCNLAEVQVGIADQEDTLSDLPDSPRPVIILSGTAQSEIETLAAGIADYYPDMKRLKRVKATGSPTAQSKLFVIAPEASTWQ